MFPIGVRCGALGVLMGRNTISGNDNGYATGASDDIELHPSESEQVYAEGS